MRKERCTIKTAKVVQNTGQFERLPRNPRQWTKEDIDKTAKSITEDADFLEDRPVLVIPRGDQYVAFAGNLRLTAAKHVKLPAVPCVVYEPESYEDWDTIKRRAMKDNGSFGAWDFDALANEWDDLPLTDWGVPAWEKEDEPEAGPSIEDVKEDDFDEDKEGILVRCKPGDIWELGEHRLMCGDSTDLETVKALMGGGLADMVFTDPPYGVAIGDKNAMLKQFVGGNSITRNIANDTLSVDDLYGVLVKAMSNVRENCKDDACYFVASPPGGDFGLMMMMMQDAGLRVRHQIVWNKDAATFSLGRLDYDYKHEALMYTWTKSHHNYRKGAFRTSVWDIPKPRKCDLHPTMKPVELVSNCLLDGSKEGDIVLDAFGGSGTTIVAAEQLGRKCYTMELDPHYCDVIIARWEKLTGKEAKRTNGA